MLVLLNFSAETALVNPGFDLKKAKKVLCNYKDFPAMGQPNLSLRPYEAVVFGFE